MRALFVRHGQSKNNQKETDDLKKHAGRQPDPPLSDLGKQQAEETGRKLRTNVLGDRRVIAAFCSPMVRAIETLEILREHGDLGDDCIFEVHPDLCEEGGLFSGSRYKRRNSGDSLVAGLTEAEISTRWPWLR